MKKNLKFQLPKLLLIELKFILSNKILNYIFNLEKLSIFNY